MHGRLDKLRQTRGIFHGVLQSGKEYTINRLD